MKIKIEKPRKSNLNRRLKHLKSVVAKSTSEFCENTTLNGLKYLTTKDLYSSERIFFGIAFTVAVFFGGYFSLNVWTRWRNTPVISGINPYPSFITQDPFPALTICNLNVAYKRKTKNFPIYSKEYAMLQLLCKRNVNTSIADSITDWSNLDQFVAGIAQPCSHMLVRCRFGAQVYNCSELFTESITDEGLCCTFNKLHSSFIFNPNKLNSTVEKDLKSDAIPVSWSLEEGYQKNLPKNYYPRPAVGTGETLGLSLVLDVEADQYYCSSLNSIGFKIITHSPMEIPSLREAGLLLSPGEETKVLINTEKFESEKKLRRTHWKYRQCFFENEKPLRLFKLYTKSNCEMGCNANLMKKHCGCIPYFLPKLRNDTICSIYQSNCVEEIRITSMLSKYNATGCEDECLPGCFDINYITNFFSAPLKNDGVYVKSRTIRKMSSSYIERNIVVLHLFHRERSYRSNQQREFYGSIDALSNIGGLIGLFLGFSFISLAELIFFAILKPCRSSRRMVKPSTNSPFWKKPIRRRFRPEVGHRKISFIS